MRGSTSPSPAGLPKCQNPIRFVTNEVEEPLSKRRRISAACRTCQRRKTKCSGERPGCKKCLDSEIECLGYQNDTKRSKPVPSRYRHEQDKPPSGVNHDLQARKHASLAGRTSPSVETPLGVFDNASSAQRPRASSPTDERTAPELADQPGDSQHDPAAAHSHPKTISPRLNRVPYFRYFGPTAIAGPGFKQMVVETNHDREPSVSSDHHSISNASTTASGQSPDQLRRPSTPRSSSIPLYSRGDSGPVSPLIKDLCETFFAQLGCNYPFLTPSIFMRELEENRIESILVDAVCAIAARFSKNPILVDAGKIVNCDHTCIDRTHKSKYGCVFSRRATQAITDVFTCPNLAAVQACLLLAYEQFGADHDSGLWVYLGLSIRMAQDLGIQKLDGLRYEGYLGPTPKTAKSGAAGKLEEQNRATRYNTLCAQRPHSPEQVEAQRRAEKERINTFWAVFFLDRVVSSGTGRPVSLRDKDIEISFPSPDERESPSHWPAPFPALIRIIHLYGCISNLLNNIREANQVTAETLKRLVAAEDDLIGIYQRLSPKLHFSAANFQHYLHHSQATNFVLLHFWFHALIVLVHQPTLLHSFEGRIQRLFPNSQELSLSSAKTIADILSFSELLGSKSFIGNPFTSQPMYIAACAFLLESAAHSTSRPQSRSKTMLLHPQPPSRSTTMAAMTSRSQNHHLEEGEELKNRGGIPDGKETGKQSLLATAAGHNYQRCYQALKTLQTYWAGTRYIVTVLDQKAKGSPDPLLYTAEDVGDGVELRGPNAQHTPDWRNLRGQSGEPFSSGHSAHLRKFTGMASPSLEASHCAMRQDSSQAIGWSLTGATNSSDSSLSVLYQTIAGEVAPPMPSFAVDSGQDLGQGPLQDTSAASGLRQIGISSQPQEASSMNSHTSVASLYGDPASPYTSFQHPGPPSLFNDSMIFPPQEYMPTDGSVTSNPEPQVRYQIERPRVDASFDTISHEANESLNGQISYNNMVIKSQNVDTSALGVDPLLWLDYMPDDVLSYLGSQNDASLRSTDMNARDVENRTSLPLSTDSKILRLVSHRQS